MKKYVVMMFLLSLTALAQEFTVDSTYLPGNMIHQSNLERTDKGFSGEVNDRIGNSLGVFSLEAMDTEGIGASMTLNLDNENYFRMDVSVKEVEAGHEALQYMAICQGGECVELKRNMYGDTLQHSMYFLNGQVRTKEVFENMVLGLVVKFPEMNFAVKAGAELIPNLSNNKRDGWPSFGNSYLSCIKQAVSDCGGSHNNGNCETFQHWGSNMVCGSIHAAGCGLLNPISTLGCAAALIF